MMRKSRALPALLLLLVGSHFGTPPSYAKNSALTPVKVKRPAKLKKYDECRFGALDSLKKGSISKEKFVSDLAGCKDRFPAADLYSQCKKDRVKEMRQKGESEVSNYCHKLVENIEYRPDRAVPFAVESTQLFFAGIGLNKAQPIDDLAPPNFSCKKLVTSARNPVSLDYVLFGNHPRYFSSLSKESAAGIRRLFPVAHPSAKGVDLPGYGRVYGDPGKPSAAVFFPSAGCLFEGPLGKGIAGLGAHYLIDTAGSLAVPYFGIIYFKDDAPNLTTQDVIDQLTQVLGESYKSKMKNTGSTGVAFVAAGDFAELDEEQDPKNLCKLPRAHTYIGIVQGATGKPQKPSFALVANIKNLCEFGDRLTEPRVH